MRLLIWGAAVTAVLLWALPIFAYAPFASYEKPEEPKALTVQEWNTINATIYGVSEYEMNETMRRESGFRPIQSGIPSSTGPNGREDSWCYAQIHLPSNPSVTRGQACDPSFASEFMAKEFSRGNQWKWAEWCKAFGFDSGVRKCEMYR